MSLIFFLSLFFCSYASIAAGQHDVYKSFLPVGDRLIYSYGDVVSGFAAKLTDEELAVVTKKVGFVDARPDRILSLHTTHTPSFLGLTRDAPGFWNDANYGRGVIVGVLDTGISPRHPSFSDNGMQPPPPRWKGRCAFNASDCNNKLIGIRAFLRGLDNATMSPYDDGGHGTHVASTAAACSWTRPTSTASPTAPPPELHPMLTLPRMDSAVRDGVDVLSLSLGGLSLPFYDDDLAIGSLGAVEKGVFVSCAAGNSGPSNGTTENEAPWILTVGASMMDRSVRATVELGNNISTFYGESLYQPDNFSAIPLPLIYPGLRGGLKTPYCVNGSLDGVDVQGKIVVCDAGAVTTVAKGRVVKAAGGLGMIVAYPQAVGFSTFENPHVLPASEVGYTDGLLIKAYAITASAPTASILFERTIVGTKPAPALVYFSSRGPNQADPNILKPDVIGPG
uniref:Subtilisin-like protease SBT1.7 n=1 Tax=Ananas comosus var. bracteatus TaxID=296719 RepID=A0A6V7QYJ6_ANACO